MEKDTNMTARILLFIAAVGVMFWFGVSVHAQDYYPYRAAPPVVVAPPPVVVAPAPPVIVNQPVVLTPEPRCHVVRETQHDDILDTNDWVEHEVCD